MAVLDRAIVLLSFLPLVFARIRRALRKSIIGLIPCAFFLVPLATIEHHVTEESS